MVNIPIRLFSLTLSLVTVWVSASPSHRSPSVVHENRGYVPHGWERSRKLGHSTVLPMRFG